MIDFLIDKNLPNTFQERLKDLIDREKKSTKKFQKEIADDLSINASDLSRYCDTSEPKNPTIKNLIKIADYFNVSVDYLVCRSDVETDDERLKIACDYTGLSIDFIQFLHNNKGNIDELYKEYIAFELDLSKRLYK